MEQQIGTAVAGYRIEELIGRGGMGFVFLATHVHLGRKVALKLLAPELTEDPKFRERFIRESQLAASLEHPNIVPIYDANEVGGQLFLAMRYVAGTDLKRLIVSEGTLDAERTISILSQAAGALDAAHAEGLIHRDVKPGNILLTPRTDFSGTDRVYLSDFGLTKRATSDSGITATGQFVGTLDYAAPEQFEGKPLDARTDVYSLGCVLYECLTGEIPFSQQNQSALVYAHLQASPPKVTDKRPDLPGGIDDVVARAMAKKPEDRYQSAGDLVGAAGAALGVAPASSSTPSTPRTPLPVSAPRRRRGLLVAGGGAALAVIVLLVVLLNLAGRSTPGGGGPNGDSSAPPAALVDYVARVDPATGQVTGRIGAGRDPTGVVIAEGSAWVANSGDDTVSRIDPVTGRVTATIKVARGPNAISADEDAIWVASLREDTISKIDPATNAVSAFHVDRRTSVMAVGDGAVWIADVQNKGPGNWGAVMDRIDTQTGHTSGELWIKAEVGGAGLGNDWAMAAAGGSLWAGGPEGVLYRIEAGTAKIVMRIGLAKPIGAISVQGDTVWVGTNTTPGVVFQIDASSGKVIATISAGGAGPRGPIRLVVDDRDVWVIDAANGSLSRVTILGGGVSLPTDVGRDPTGVAVGLGSVWVTVNGGG